MKIHIDRNLKTPLYLQIAREIKKKILGGELQSGAVLPSERGLGEILGVHRNTIIKAYALLKDEGLVDSRGGAGYFVVYNITPAEEPDVRRRVNWSTIIKDEYQDMEKTFDSIFQRATEENYISLSTGMAPSVYAEEEIAADLASVLEEDKKPFYLSPYQGDLTLRREISSYLRTKGIKAGIGQIQIMSETNQALDFIISAILKEGECVIVEEPVSPDVYRVIELAGVRAITVPVDDNGMVCDKLEGLIEKWKPRFIYVNSSFHDPTGNILSLERRKKLLHLSNIYRIPIIEEDAASELAFTEEVLPTIKSMDRSDNVIYIYSFSLTFVPGLSMAFVVAPEKLTRSLSYLVSVRMMSLDWITQKLLARYITDGRYYEKVKGISQISREKRDLMCKYLDRGKAFGISYKKPEGGVYIWCMLPEGVNNRDVVSESFKRGVSVVPGDLFYPERSGGQNYIRLCYSYESKERISLGMENLLEVIEKLVP